MAEESCLGTISDEAPVGASFSEGELSCCTVGIPKQMFTEKQLWQRHFSLFWVDPNFR